MVVYLGLDAVRPSSRPAAVAVGNFDGLHLGHRKILGRLCALARERGLRSLVLTFHPHPERALGRKSVKMIDTLEQRLDRFRETCVDAVVVTSFDASFAGLGCRAFAREVLQERLRAREVVVGQSFRFGRNRRGDTSRLRELGRGSGFEVHTVPPVLLDGEVISSSAARRLLDRGLVGRAARLLGRPYEIAGRVVGGRAVGHGLGFPTANLMTANEILPTGVYISETVRKGRAWPSVTSIGTNPTFGPGPLSVETHVLDRRPSLDGALLKVRLLRRIRPTRKFPGPGPLASRIARDIEEARAFFEARRASG
ncbi:MAG: riboflavin biosynthesis protein RibF [Candidatus Aminicenantes bacterium]|nr:riboflavin biosynthesis protein RibF [Candidatus Aminicenantes bacterium]